MGQHAAALLTVEPVEHVNGIWYEGVHLLEAGSA